MKVYSGFKGLNFDQLLDRATEDGSPVEIGGEMARIVPYGPCSHDGAETCVVDKSAAKYLIVDTQYNGAFKIV